MPRQLDVARAGDGGGQVPAGPPVDDPVAAPVGHQRRHLDRGQHRADVDVEEHLEDLLDHRRAGGRALHARGELDRLGVVARSSARTARPSPRRRGPRTARSARWRPRAGRRRARPTGSPAPASCGPSRRGARARVTRSGWVAANEHAHRPALRDAQQRGPLEPAASMTARTSSMRCSSVGASVTGSERPVPRLSKRIEARERGEPLEEARERRELPLQLQVRDEPEDEHEVDRPVADDLVGDRGVARGGVLGGRSAHRSCAARA